MFAYSLTGLQLQEGATADVEIEENETTARSAVYQVLGRLAATPDDDYVDKAIDGRWLKELTAATTLLPYAWEIGEPVVDGDSGREVFSAEYARVFLGADRTGILEHTYRDDGEQCITELARSYQYFGLGAGDLARDHLSTEFDFMQYLTFKEAAAASPRLGRSYQRAQLEFLDRHLGGWVPRMGERVRSTEPMPFFEWVANRMTSFVEVDHSYARTIGA
jgi:putative dimethyl sulfoxide reductase chaperone